MGDIGSLDKVRELSKFALSVPFKQRVGHSLRRRRKSIDCDDDHGRGEKNKDGAGNSSVIKARSTKLKRSDEIATNRRVQFTKLEKSGLAAARPWGYKRLDARFFECDALELAPKLLGKLIRREDVILQITETEAYRPGDSACHARVGQTARTAPLFGPAGHAYVYLCYGIHSMLNVVADKVGVGAAVLIRACSPVSGLNCIQLRRGQVTDKPILLTGPGKVGQALGLTTEWSTHPLYTPGGLEMLDGPSPSSMLVGPRVGINYADTKDVAALWRFAIADTAWISAPRSTLRLLKQ